MSRSKDGVLKLTGLPSLSILQRLDLGIDRGQLPVPRFDRTRPFRRRKQGDQISRLLFGFTTWECKSSAVQNSVNRVIVFRRNRIKLVIVAASTSNRQPQNRLPQRVDRIFKRQMHELVAVMIKAARDRQIASAHYSSRILLRRIIGMNKIPSDLFADKLIIWQIFIERINHPVSISPRIRNWMIGVFAGGVGITNNIQPMPAPVFTVMRRLQ